MQPARTMWAMYMYSSDWQVSKSRTRRSARSIPKCKQRFENNVARGRRKPINKCLYTLYINSTIKSFIGSCTAHAPARSHLRSRLDWRVQRALAPFGPRAVVNGDVAFAESSESERQRRGGHARAAAQQQGPAAKINAG
eukprot:6173368-Pleurochrysis_carterae.AAC.7